MNINTVDWFCLALVPFISFLVRRGGFSEYAELSREILLRKWGMDGVLTRFGDCVRSYACSNTR